MKNILLYILLTICVSINICAERVIKVNDLCYGLNETNHTAFVTRNWLSSSVLTTYKISNATIPDVVIYENVEYVVTSIEKYAFYQSSSLKTITLSNNITSIGNSAFSECTSLTSITLGNNITYIGQQAFYKCTSLNSITIPDSVSCVQEETFALCTNLSSIHLGEKTDTIKEGAFKSCDISSISLGNNIKSIEKAAFSGCTKLTSVNIPQGITSIEDDVFANCHSLVNVNIPNSVLNIGKSSFACCRILKSITLPSNIIRINNYAFSDCWALDSIIIPNSVEYIGNAVFKFCKRLSSITIRDGVTHIGDQAFWGCDSLKSIEIPANVTSIGSNAFSFCNNLKIVIMKPLTPPTLGVHPFDYYTAALEDIIVPCQTLNAYKTAASWTDLSDIIRNEPLEYKVSVKKSELGTIEYPISLCDDTILTAIPNTGYHFVSWSDGSTMNPRYFSLTQDTLFAAEFALNTYSLSIIYNDEEGIIDGVCGVFEHGTEHTFTATPNAGYRFDKWSDNISDNPRTVVLVQDTLLVAQFIQTFVVQFFDFNEVLIEKQIIDKGDNAIAPEPPIVENYDFIGWDKELSNIQSNLDVYAIYEQKVNDIENILIDRYVPQKFLHEGQIYILQGGMIYTIQGQRIY